MDVGLVEIDQEMAIALSALQQALELCDKGLPPLRVGLAEQLLGLFPGQIEAVQGRPDRLAADAMAETLAHIRHQALEGPARRRVGAIYGRDSRRVSGRAHDLVEAGLDARAKGGRPPVRR
jgi:hypothetical protein